MKDLESLKGLNKVKDDIKNLVSFIKIRNIKRERDSPVPAMSFHLVSTGNPGTGKTTDTRMIAKIYKALGVLSGGQLVELDRSGSVMGYVGQTAVKTQEILQSAVGGVLFIDGAYTLANKGGNDLGQDFINSNPGLKSRFGK